MLPPRPSMLLITIGGPIDKKDPFLSSSRTLKENQVVQGRSQVGSQELEPMKKEFRSDISINSRQQTVYQKDAEKSDTIFFAPAFPIRSLFITSCRRFFSLSFACRDLPGDSLKSIDQQFLRTEHISTPKSTHGGHRIFHRP